MKNVTSKIKNLFPAPEVSAHCDGPCGVYDPADARIKAEAVLSMTKKILALAPPDMGDPKSMVAYLNTVSRYVQIKEEQAHEAKTQLLVLWTDFFKPVHLEKEFIVKTGAIELRRAVSGALAHEGLDTIMKSSNQISAA